MKGTDFNSLVRDEIALRASIAEASRPTLQVLQKRARRRTRRARGMTAAAAAAVVVGCAIAVQAPWSSAPVPREADGSRQFELSTYEPRGSGEGGYDIAMVGTLRFTADNCPYLGSSGVGSPLVFPEDLDWHGEIRDDGTRLIVDSQGTARGVEGEPVRAGSGGVPALGAPTPQPCLANERPILLTDLKPRR